MGQCAGGIQTVLSFHSLRKSIRIADALFWYNYLNDKENLLESFRIDLSFALRQFIINSIPMERTTYETHQKQTGRIIRSTWFF